MSVSVLPFCFEGREVRVVNRDGAPWCVMSDVCTVLGLGSPHKAAERLDDDEKGRTIIPTLEGLAKLAVILPEWEVASC